MTDEREDLEYKPHYSSELLRIAEKEVLYKMGVYLPDSPCLDENGKKTLSNFDAYIRERMQKMYGDLVLIDSETGQEKIGKDFLDDFEFLICDEYAPNAFIIDKKYFQDKKHRICVTTALLTFCKQNKLLEPNMEAVLVGVVGHEIGHAIYSSLKSENKQVAKDEEAGADILAMAHMTNAGYHPKHLLNFFKCLKESGKSQSFINKLADVHPSLELRQDIQAGVLGVEEGLLDQLSQQPPQQFDEELYQQLQALPPINQHILNYVQSEQYKALSPREQVLDFFNYIRTFQIPLYHDEDFQYNKDNTENDIWDKILTTHISPMRKIIAHKYAPRLDTQIKPYQYNYLNFQHLKRIYPPENLSLNEYVSLVKELFAKTQAEEEAKQQALQEEPKKSWLSKLLGVFQKEPEKPIIPEIVYSNEQVLWTKWLDLIYQNTQKNEFTDENDSLSDLHKLIRQLLTTDENPHELMKQIKAHPDFNFLIRGSYTHNQHNSINPNCVRTLLNPYQEPLKVGEKLAFLPLFRALAKEDPSTNTEEKHYSYSTQCYELETDRNNMDNDYWTYTDDIHPLLTTLHIYDTQAFNYQLNKRYLLETINGQIPIFGLKELTLTAEDYQKYAPYHICFQQINDTLYEYHYDNDGTILSVEEKKQSFLFKPWEIILKNVINYRQDVYKIKTEGLNTQLHFQLCDILQRLPHADVSLQTINDLNNITPYFYDDEKILDFEQLPLASKEMNWKWQKSPFISIDSKKYKDLKEKYNSHYLFKFDSNATNNITQKYIDVLTHLLKAYDANPNNHETIEMLNAVRQSPSVWNLWRFDKEIGSHINPDLLKLFNHPFMREAAPESFKNYLQNTKIGLHLIHYAPDLYYQIVKRNKTTSYDEIVRLRNIRNWNSIKDSTYQINDTVYHSEQIMFFADKTKDIPIEELNHFIKKIKTVSQVDDIKDIPDLHQNLKESILHRISQFDMEQNADDLTTDTCATVLSLRQHKLFEENETDETIKQFFQKFKAEMLSMDTMEERRSMINLLPHGQVLDFISNDLFRWSDNPNETIWTGTLEEQILTYNNCVYNALFTSDGIVQRDILTHLIDTLEKQPADVREKLSFQLLAERNPIDFIDLHRRVEQIWLNSVAETLNHQTDDRSAEFEEKIKHISEKLKNNIENTEKEFMEDLPYSRLAVETQEQLSTQLQDIILAQEKTADLLQVDAKSLAGILNNNQKITGIGMGLEVIYHILHEKPHYGDNIIKFILEPNSYENAKAFHELIGQELISTQSSFYITLQNIFKNTELQNHITIEDGQHFYNLLFSPEKWMRFHAQFWEKPFKMRTFMLANLFNQSNPNSHYRTNKMMHFILPENMPNRQIFFDALRNYAQAVPDDEEYRTDLLLGGCIAANKPTLKNQGETMNMPQIIRLFLESQGAAGIKVGQFLSVQESLPKDVRDELLKLTNHAKTPSRAEVFETIRKYHPELIKTIRENPTGLGKVLGAASHYLTFELNENEVVSVARDKTDLDAQAVYKRLQEALRVTITQHEEYADMLHIVQDAISATRKMNKYELDANCGYLQMCIAQQLYDNVQMNIDGYTIDFRTMPWTKQPDAYCSVVTDGTVQYLQSYKIMEKAKGVDYTDIADESKSPEKTGITIDMDEQKRMKKALAKANFLINLRAVMLGGAFDDDRHQGQLKVQLNPDKKLHVELFDTGSTSLESPMREDIKLLGSVFYRTLHGYLTVKLGNPAQKKFYLKRLFPKSDTKKLMNLEASDAFCTLFNASVECVRDKDGHVPHYIAKAERAIANLRHFSCDIPNEEVLPLVLTLWREKGHMHPDIINGMVETADTDRDKLILQTLFNGGQLNTAFIFGENDATKTAQPSIQSTGVYGKVETALYQILHGADNLPQAEQAKYFDTLVGIFEDIQKGIPYQKIIHQAHKRQSPMCRKTFDKNLLQLFSALMTDDMQKQSLTDRLMAYLEREGLPEPLIQRVTQKMSFKNKLILKVALLRKNRLTLFKSTAKNLLQPYLEMVSNKITQFRTDYIQQSSTDKVVLTAGNPTAGQIDRDLPEREINVTNARSNELVNAMNIMYKKNTEKN